VIFCCCCLYFHLLICGSFTALSISLVIRDDYDRLQLQEGIFLPSELAERLLHQVQARDFPISELSKTGGFFKFFPSVADLCHFGTGSGSGSLTNGSGFDSGFSSDLQDGN
jgi:hypothetical protein